jgi:hypothetical protein
MWLHTLENGRVDHLTVSIPYGVHVYAKLATRLISTGANVYALCRRRSRQADPFMSLLDHLFGYYGRITCTPGRAVS